MLAIVGPIRPEYRARAELVIPSPKVGLETRRALGVAPGPATLPFRDAALDGQPNALLAIAQRAGSRLRLGRGGTVASRVRIDAPRPVAIGTAEDAGLPINWSVVAAGPDPRRTASIANAFAQGYVAYRQQALRLRVVEVLNRRALRAGRVASPIGQRTARPPQAIAVAVAEEAANVRVTRAATVPTRVSSPRIVRDVVVAGLVGLLASLTLLRLADRRDREPVSARSR